MSLIPWSPLWPMEDVEKMAVSPIVPPADIYETNTTVEIKIPLAGVSPQKVDISVKGNVLTVQGKMDKKTEVEEKDYYRKEIRTGSFYRSLPLPTAVIGEKASAQMANGMLMISVPKTVKVKSKAVKIQVKK
ncbi:MAG: Hsp20/alpha crystallin family protein [Patescibacteria group bacterium]|nr:Hsp20/alpha crystallin family protein [Patescibacteria group bacterium]